MESVIARAAEPDDTKNMATSIKFEHFDMLNDVAKDHHYLMSKSYKAKASVMKEWEILKDNLPDSIYVQAYEPRIDLLRAVIIGPHLTPYHDGLFFFDIYLPSDYPNNPPQVYYHSHGYRLNPNLYRSGYVCLSLINTWSSSDRAQRWRKEQSTILQLLVSIQGLVLNERPFFNEPGYANHKTSLDPKWVNLSKSYDESVFIISCQSMMQIMRKPLVGFANFIVEHFKERSDSILAAVKAYENGDVLVGQFQMGCSSSSSSLVQVSVELKARLKKIGEDLEKEFARIHGIASNEEKNDKNEVQLSQNREPNGGKNPADITEKNGTQLSHETKSAMNSQEQVKNQHQSSVWGSIFCCFMPTSK